MCWTDFGDRKVGNVDGMKPLAATYEADRLRGTSSNQITGVERNRLGERKHINFSLTMSLGDFLGRGGDLLKTFSN